MRQAVKKFAEAMERKLKKHDDSHGPEGWLGEPDYYLFDRLEEEVKELRTALANKQDTKAKGEAVDVANFAMMIWDNIIRYDG